MSAEHKEIKVLLCLHIPLAKLHSPPPPPFKKGLKAKQDCQKYLT